MRIPRMTRWLARVTGVAATALLIAGGAVLPAQAGSGPSISSFYPTSGPVGTGVTIHGSNFTGTSSVWFNGTSAGFSLNGGGTQIATTVPSGATTGPITVTTSNGTAQTSTNFTVTSSSGPPSISSFSPRSGPVGTSVTITGYRFSGVTSVTFNGRNATFTVNGAGTQISTTVPSGATTGKISVSGPNGSDQSYGDFTVTSVSAPNVTGFSPTSGKVGTAVTINGSGFTGTTQVRFNGTAATSFSVVNSGKITTTVPNGATTGKISVTNSAGTDYSNGNFTVTGPHITSFSPTSGPVGTSVTLYGSNFTGVTSVRFNSLSASFTFVNSGTVRTVVPSGATSGPISLTTPSGTTSTTTNFTVTGGTHARTISLALNHGRRLFAVGSVSVNDGYAACKQHVPVVIKRFRGGRWRWVATTSTGQDGGYRVSIRDYRGRYRAKASRIQLVNGVTCRGDRSNVVRYHR